MAEIKKILKNEEYMRCLTYYVSCEIEKQKQKQKNSIDENRCNIIEIKKIFSKPLTKKTDSEDNDSDDDSDDEINFDRNGDDFDICELSRYEDAMIATLKMVISKDSSFLNKKINAVYFNCNDENLNIYNNAKICSEGWLYVITVGMLCGNDLIEYTHIDHVISKYYKCSKHIIGVNKKLTFEGNDEKFDVYMEN